MTQRSSFGGLFVRLYACLLLPALSLLSCSDEGEMKEDGGGNQTAGERDASGSDDGSDGDDADAGGSSTRDGGSTGTGSTGGSDAARPAGGSSDGGVDATVARDAGVSRDASPTSSEGGTAEGGGAVDPGGLAHFSFFVTSQAAIVELAANAKGFGGDLRHGETGSGAGLRGADKICAEIAERSMEGASVKQWRAFLSASTGGAGGGAVNARDRIGQGPWYDRKGRLVGNALADLLSGDRPSAADVLIRDDLPNETGTGNRAPNGTQLDNHDTLTGSDSGGRYVSGSNTCLDWTSASTTTVGSGGGGGGGSGPSIGHSWPRSANMGRNWLSDHRAGGCGQGINTSNGSTDGTPTVGSGGGYGGFYCFALEP